MKTIHQAASIEEMSYYGSILFNEVLKNNDSLTTTLDGLQRSNLFTSLITTYIHNNNIPKLNNDYEHYKLVDNSPLSTGIASLWGDGDKSDNVTELARKITAQITYTKNTITPVIKEMGKLLIEALTENKKNSTHKAYNIVEYTLPDVINTDQFQQILNRHKPFDIKAPVSLRMQYNSHDNDSILKYSALNGAHTVNGFSKSLTSEDMLCDIKQLFDGIIPKHSTHRLDCYVAAIIISYNTIDDIPSDVTETAKSFRENVTRNLPELIKLYLKELDVYKRAIKNGYVIKSKGGSVRSVEGKCIYVYKEPYRKWIDKGGVPEIMLGLSLTDNVIIGDLEDHLPNTKFGDAAMHEWEKYVAEAKEIHLLQTQANIKSIIEVSYIRCNEECPVLDIEANARELIKYDDGIAKSNLSKVNDKLIASITNDPIMAAADIITKTRFYYTDASNFTNAMFSAAKNDTEMSAEDSASVALIDYIVRYITKEISKS